MDLSGLASTVSSLHVMTKGDLYFRTMSFYRDWYQSCSLMITAAMPYALWKAGKSQYPETN
jgi:hypothetical protein